ncbi:hypothetical protein E2C01_091200 [Portunus trituberculatus]|uniref:Uncharacterized protein n=1 Tax=Portunus trituberculatus TaxID=210409 RepID=A0A5B7JGR7_PORTR|nr:hypothetical protein [Portunus trituberculatus]
MEEGRREERGKGKGRGGGRRGGCQGHDARWSLATLQGPADIPRMLSRGALLCRPDEWPSRRLSPLRNPAGAPKRQHSLLKVLRGKRPHS